MLQCIYQWAAVGGVEGRRIATPAFCLRRRLPCLQSSEWKEWSNGGRKEGGKEERKLQAALNKIWRGNSRLGRKRLKTRQAVSLLGSVLCVSVTSVSQCRDSIILSQGKKEDMLSLFFRWCVPNWVMFMSGLFAVTPLPHSNGRHGITSFATLMWMAAHCSAAQPAACKVSQYAPSSISHSLCCLALWEL